MDAVSACKTAADTTNSKIATRSASTATATAGYNSTGIERCGVYTNIGAATAACGIIGRTLACTTAAIETSVISRSGKFYTGTTDIHI